MELSARMLPFPGGAGRLSASDRLETALSRLGTALAAQKAAVATWRGALSELAAQVRSTEATLLAHQATLGELRTGIALLHDQALAVGKAVGGAG